jgi:hypothetical protein
MCWKKNPNGILVNIGGAGRGGSVNIRPRPAPGIGANFLNHNRPVTSTGRVKPARVGAGRFEIAIPSSRALGSISIYANTLQASFQEVIPMV